MLVTIKNKISYYTGDNDKSIDAINEVMGNYTVSKDLFAILVSELLLAGYSVKLKD